MSFAIHGRSTPRRNLHHSPKEDGVQPPLSGKGYRNRNPITGCASVLEKQEKKSNEDRKLCSRPLGVPSLDLQYLQEKELPFRRPPDVYDYAVSTPDTFSTVSWGTPKSSERKMLADKSRRAMKNCPHPCVPSLQMDEETHSTCLAWKPKISAWDQPAVPEDLPGPAPKYRDLYKQYSDDMKESYRTHTNKSQKQDIQKDVGMTEESKQDALKQDVTGVILEEEEEKDPELKLLEENWTKTKLSLAQKYKKGDIEELEDHKKKEKLVETVLIDQLSRAVISDPEQNNRAQFQIYSPYKPRGSNRFLHDSCVRTRQSATENLLSKRVRFGVRILTRNGIDAMRELMGFFFYVDKSMTVYEFKQFGKSAKALPFISRGQYPQLDGPSKGQLYTLCNIYLGSNISIDTTEQQSLPDALRRNQVIVLRVTDVAEKEKSDILLANVRPSEQAEMYMNLHLPQNKEEIQKAVMILEVQNTVKSKLKKRGIRTVTGLGQYYRKLSCKGDCCLNRCELEQGLQKYHIDLPTHLLDAAFEIVDVNQSGVADYSDYMRAILGEMNEVRKSFVRKSFQKIGGAKKGVVRVGEMKKFYNAGSHTQVNTGGAVFDALQLFLDAFNKSSLEDETVMYLEYEEYYEGASIGVEKDEDFINILRNTWNL